ncbi:sensor histidine kinase [Rhodococcus sp. ARC_M6]|uniref:sensor histidine kinase n=1 Tax=Rhodococcus sp. ARC_M6 TaxID=2928852 RepID=UPI001FB42C38|nr:sensor histidine kinase [Rhodococcus sp. ARC_M6]MCJ0902053.1 sensor domain-containing protein [Rhodococcus sp. ARC_M6]
MKQRFRAARYVLVEGCAAVVSLAVVIAGLLLISLSILVVGWALVPAYVRALRWWAGLARRRAAEYTDRPVPQRYPPLPDNPTLGDLRRLLTDQSMRRDCAWVAIHSFAALVAGILTFALPLGALNSFVVPFYWQAMPDGEPVSNLYPVTSWWGAAGMPVVGLMYLLLAWWLIPAMARWLSALASTLLAPDARSDLSRRVTALTASRAAALDAHSAELKRIERDLHDGAQNRLVAVVMMLGMAERALQNNPDQALPQLRRAQDAATEALSELRTLVHDIYPPILDELGLEGAVSALAGRSVVPCVLDVEKLRRAPAAVEAAAYFVVAEALTNVAKHSGAHTVTVRVWTESDPETMVIEVLDNGRGGATSRPGGGIAGIRRRTSAFEGTVMLDSPVAGPTTMKVELPCGF